MYQTLDSTWAAALARFKTAERNSDNRALPKRAPGKRLEIPCREPPRRQQRISPHKSWPRHNKPLGIHLFASAGHC